MKSIPAIKNVIEMTHNRKKKEMIKMKFKQQITRRAWSKLEKSKTEIKKEHSDQ